MLKKSKIISIILAVLLTFLVFASCGGNNGLRKADYVYHAGEAFVVENRGGAPYHINGINYETVNNCVVLDGYVFDKNGQSYDIYNNNDVSVGKIKLIKQEKQTVRVNLDTCYGNMYEIQEDVNEIEFYSLNGKNKELFIFVDPRETCLRVIFNNVHLYTVKRMPVFMSLNEVDISVTVIGDCSFYSGDAEITKEDVEEFQSNLEYLNGLAEQYPQELATVALYAAVSHVTVVEGLNIVFYTPKLFSVYIILGYVTYRFAKAYKEGGIHGVSNDAYNMIESMNNRILKLVQDVFYRFTDSLYGEDGVDGYNGSDVFVVSGGLLFKGEGNLTISASSGTDGTDGTEGYLGNTKGGNGGDGGNAITCFSLINIMNKSDYNVSGGNGGYGGIGHGKSNGTNGAKGRAFNAKHIFKLS